MSFQEKHKWSRNAKIMHRQQQQKSVALFTEETLEVNDFPLVAQRKYIKIKYLNFAILAILFFSIVAGVWMSKENITDTDLIISIVCAGGFLALVETCYEDCRRDKLLSGITAYKTAIREKLLFIATGLAITTIAWIPIVKKIL